MQAEFRVVREFNGELVEDSAEPVKGKSGLSSGIAKARRLAREFPPDGGCFGNPGVNPTAIVLQAQNAKDGTWTGLSRFKFVPKYTRTGCSLKVVEEGL